MTRVDDLSPELAPELALELGLRADEYEAIVKSIGRTPTVTELYMYSLMWSEHCSYKHSRTHLRMFPTTGPAVLQGPGENAGVISVGEGWAVAFKMESHNHPSAIEPYEGAATGVGGCMRDIFAMGARPFASLGALRFGTLDKARQRFLYRGAVEGISDYSNMIGVPVLGGDVYFDEAYEGNCLINAMGVGLLREENLTRAQASGVGNNVVIIGSTTGRDGIGAASLLASSEFTEVAEDMRPAVQAGDAATEKLLIDACLELLDKKMIVGLGDLGAAGLTSSASEMASRADAGIDIDVSKVPQREENMKPFEIMVSESQERMLAVVTPEDTEECLAICEKWGVLAVVIGKVTDTGNFVVRVGDVVYADIPAHSLTEEAPLYDPEKKRPAHIDELAAFDPNSLDLAESETELKEAFYALLSAPNIASRAESNRQYDSDIGSNTIIGPGADASVMRIGDPGTGMMTNRGIALATDCNGRYVYLNPYRGAQIALAEAARNVSCVGAEPAAITDCLNYGSPEKPEVYYSFVESVRGLADACKEFEIPVVSGNVSFYNESFGQAIYPTPAIGIVGVVEDLDYLCTPDFKDEGDTIILLGETYDELGGSEYLKLMHETVAGDIPALDIETEIAVQKAVRTAIKRELINAAHDCSEGGLAIALAKMCIDGAIGAEVTLDDDLSNAASLFAESQSRIVVALADDKVEEFVSLLVEDSVPFSVIGVVGGDELIIEDKLRLDLEEISDIYENSLSLAVKE